MCLEHISYITANCPEMCLMLDRFLWGHSSRYCDISCLILISRKFPNYTQTGFNLQNQPLNFTLFNLFIYYATAMIMAGTLSVTPVRPSVCTYVCSDDVRSLNRILLIRILYNLGTLFSTIMSSSNLIMVHIAPGFQ